MSKELIAAIIGYWRGGAKMEEMQQATGLPDWKINEVILNFISNENK